MKHICKNCKHWKLNELCIWAVKAKYGKCDCKHFQGEYLWDKDGADEDGLIILEIHCMSGGFLTGSKFGCVHWESKCYDKCEDYEDG